MIAPELDVGEQPRTRDCRRCGVEINAASARCPYCGARQYRRQPILGWRGALVCLVAVAAAVFATRQVVESHTSPVSFTYYSGDVTALVPAGYHDIFLAAPHGTALVEFQSPAHPNDTETVQATVPAAGTPASRLAARVHQLRNTPGVALGYHGLTLLPGGRTVPAVYYTQNGYDYAVFDFDACNHAIAMTVTLSTATKTLLGQLSQVLPQAADANCDKPAFTAQDRADTAIPLALPR